MDHASTINFLSNEDTPELAPGFFITGGMFWAVHPGDRFKKE
jgi:hypothetical protein